MPLTPSSRSNDAGRNERQGSVSLIHKSSDKSLEIKGHDQKVRSNRKARLSKAVFRRHEPVRIQPAGQLSTSTVQMSCLAKVRSLYKDGGSGSLQTVLGQGRRDPFITLPVGTIAPIVHEVIDHGFRYFWHALIPRPGSSALNPINRVKLNAMYSSKLAYYAYTMAVVGNYWLLLGPEGVTKAQKELLLTHRVATLRLINQELANMKGVPSEELIGAIIVMAAADPDHFLRQADARQSKFQSPLAKAQLLHILGHESLTSAHYLALWRLLHMKGAGWEEYHDFGLAEICELLCIIHASIAGANPEFPAINRSQQAFFSGNYDTGDATKDLRLAISRALPSKVAISLLELSFLRFKPAMMDVISLMRRLNLALDQFYRGGRDAPDFADIIRARNAIQHRILSLPQDPKDISPAGTYLYKLCRICLLIYSNMIFFPLPPSSGVGGRLVTALKALVVEESQKHLFARKSTDFRLLLWAVVLGGISDGSDIHRSWFLRQYCWIASDIGVVSWQQLETHLISFLWLDFVLNKEAVGFWAESRMRNAPVVLP